MKKPLTELDFTIVAGAVHSDVLIHNPAGYGGRNLSTNRRIRGTANDKLY